MRVPIAVPTPAFLPAVVVVPTPTPIPFCALLADKNVEVAAPTKIPISVYLF
jgi:hypothetical protein